MKHLKPYHLFENIHDDEDLLEIKEIVQGLVDDWSIEWIDANVLQAYNNALGKKNSMDIGDADWENIEENDFIYNIRRVVGDRNWIIICDFILPARLYQNQGNENWQLFIKQIEECVQRIYNIGYDDVEWYRPYYYKREPRHIRIIM